jgi:hypothetical protein
MLRCIWRTPLSLDLSFVIVVFIMDLYGHGSPEILLAGLRPMLRRKQFLAVSEQLFKMEYLCIRVQGYSF